MVSQSYITALYPDYGGSTFTIFLPHYKQSHSTRQWSSLKWNLQKCVVLTRQFTHIYSETSHSGEKYPFKMTVHYINQSLVFGEHYHSSQTVRHKSQSSQTTAEITYSQNMSQTIKCFKNHRSQLFVSNTCRQFKESCTSGVINLLLRYSS